MNDCACSFVIAIGFVVTMFFVGIFIGSLYTRDDMELKAVEHGCAQYGAQTGKWEWKK